jgi:NAD(P)-dependent dehydrogenase (short-subunit alcohol dehydrogenase family)
MKGSETAIVFGVGSGLGWALVKRLAADNMRVGAVARNEANLAKKGGTIIFTGATAALRGSAGFAN